MSDVLSHLSASEAPAAQMPPPLICQHAHCVSASLCCVCLSVHCRKESEREESGKTTAGHSDLEMKYQRRPVKRR